LLENEIKKSINTVYIRLVMYIINNKSQNIIDNVHEKSPKNNDEKKQMSNYN